ncbi:hypothetical protein [Halorussus salinisoli]|uniref:hypothetical protein n=1 Tax=Halorussus salinisoli TaxID=2558242 RepID=UPI0010C17D04|nr:hypothetical protein [Halorussus salinisoli]
MPSHSLTPYKVVLREKGEPDNHWNLKNLTAHDRQLPHEDFIDTVTALCEHYAANPAADDDLEKTFHIDEYSVENHLVEGIIRTGDHGYSSTLRDIETNETRKKKVTEAEELPFYFALAIPRTHRGELYENGKEAILVVQRINRRGVKTTLLKQLREMVTGDTDDTLLEVNPIYTQDVLDKLIESNRVLKAEFKLRESNTTDDEQRYRLLEGVDQEDTRSKSVVWEAGRGGTLAGFREKARELQGTDGTFAELVNDDVSDLKVQVEKETGGMETFSLLEDNLRMTKRIERDDLRLYEGLPTTQSIARHARAYINQVLDSDIVEPIDTRTQLPNVRMDRQTTVQS